jgi:type IV pilus assembly protein PilY1
MKDGSNTNWYLILGSGPTTLDGQSSQTAKVAVVPLDWLAGSNRRALRIPDALPSSANAEGGRFELTSDSFVSDLVAVDFDLEADYKADAVYFGTLEGSYAAAWSGQLYRLVTQKKQPDAYGNLVQVATLPHEWQGLLTTNPVPLIDTEQPITAAPAVGWDGHNYWVYVGTGRFFDVQDKADTGQQAFYGIKEPLDCDGQFTWQTVAKTGTHNGTPGAQGLLRVDQIRVQQSSYGSNAALSCLDGSTSCLPSITYFDDLVDYIVGAGCAAGDPTGTDGWYFQFPAARERNLGQSTLLGGLLTFSTYQPFDDVCLSEGLSDVYGIFYQTGTAWHESVFGTVGVLDDGTITPMIDLGPGLTRVPNLHVGMQAGSTAFFQASTGAIIKIEHALHPIKNHKTGRVSWMENP